MKTNSYHYWLNLARRHSRLPADAEDLLQESLLVALQEKRNPLQAGSNVDSAWFAGVIRKQAAFRARTAIRARQREQASEQLQAKIVERTVESTADSTDAAEPPVWPQLLTGLPESQRRVLLLALHGMSRPEICRVLGIADTALRQRLTSLRRFMKARRGKAGSSDLHELARHCERQLLLANPPDAGQRRATLNRGPQRLASFRFGLSDPDGYLLGIAGRQSGAAPDRRESASQKGMARQLEDGNDPENGA